jgi:hypothetical protein
MKRKQKQAGKSSGQAKKEGGRSNESSGDFGVRKSSVDFEDH